MVIPGIFFKAEYTGFKVSEVLSIAMLKEILLVPPINPKTKIKTSGKARLKTTLEGLFNSALKLALVIDHKAVSWLYFTFIKNLERQIYFNNKINSEEPLEKLLYFII